VLALLCQPVAAGALAPAQSPAQSPAPASDAEPALGDARTPDGPKPSPAVVGTPTETGAPATETGSTLGGTAGPATASDIVVEKTLRLTPDEPGVVAATFTYRIPDAVSSFTTRIAAPDVEIAETTRFERVDGELEWTGEGDTASVTFDYRVNRTRSDGGRALSRAHLTDRRDGGMAFVDAGEWAIAPVPTVGARWTRTADVEVSLRTTTSVEGSGVAGGSMAYLGEYELLEREGVDQTIQLVVPAAATLREEPDAIADSLTAASADLRIGARDDRVVVIAAPTSVDWAAGGLQYGDAEAWVQADARLDTPNNVWVHEYVHTRQAFNVTTPGGVSETRWLTEASADYYAALLTLEQGRIGYDAFRDRLARGGTDPYAEAVMTEPATWLRSNANYIKGALVLAAVDRRIRERTDGSRSLQTVVRGLNQYDEPDRGSEAYVSAETYYSLVGGGDEALREYAVRTAATDAVPETWSQATHEATFAGLPALFEYGVPDATVESRYRSGPLDGAPTVVPGETVTLTYAVENVGGATGAYAADVVVDGALRRTWTGELAAGERATATVRVTFEAPGEHTIRVGGRTTTVRVRELATATVTALSASSERTDAGAAVTLTTTLENRQSVPANRTLTYVVDGEVVDTATVVLAPGESRTVEKTLSVAGAGEHTVGIRGLDTTTVTVPEEPEPPVSVPTPGFGPLAAMAAIAVVFGRRLRA